MEAEDRGCYQEGWVKYNQSELCTHKPRNQADAYVYRTSEELQGYPYWGNHHIYSGGGFVASLGKTREDAEESIRQLMKNQWIESFSRVVFVEFLLYNQNVNLFAVSQIAFETPATGGVFPFYKMHVMRLDRYRGPFKFVAVGAEVLTLCFIIFFIIRECKEIKKEKKEYFKTAWNIGELLMLSMCIIAIVMFFYRLFVAARMSFIISQSSNSFHNFDYLVIWDEAYGYLLGLIVFGSTIKFIKLLRFNKRMALLSNTLAFAAPSLLNFGMMFGVVFLAFAQLAYLIFKTRMIYFSSFIRTMETLSVQMLNKFDFGTMVKADRVFGPTIFFLFTLSVTFILLNFFIIIILEAFSVVKADVSKQSNEHEIVDFIMDRFKLFTGIGHVGKKRKGGPRCPPGPGDPEYEEALSAFKQEEVQQKLEAFCRRLEKLIHAEHTEGKDNFLDLMDTKKRKLFMSN